METIKQLQTMMLTQYAEYAKDVKLASALDEYYEKLENHKEYNELLLNNKKPELPKTALDDFTGGTIRFKRPQAYKLRRNL